MSALTHAIARLAIRADLSAAEMKGAVSEIMSGAGTPAQIGALLMGLRVKGETVTEIVAAAEVLRDLSTRVAIADSSHLVDTCGTGGDGASTFNISTAAAIVCACAGAKVAKHGNRSVSSRSGSADVLEAAGALLTLTPEQVALCIERVGVGFLFAPRHHEAMRHAALPRRELGIRTLFNMLGPLTNPARAPYQLVGVFSRDLLEPFASALAALGGRHALVVHSEDGLDEISPAAPTEVCEMKEGVLSRYRLAPTDFGLPAGDLGLLKVDSAQMSLEVLRRVLAGRDQGPAAVAVILNAGAALYVAGLVADIGAGVARARALLQEGRPAAKLAEFVTLTHGFT
ncbi:anthranilate phosphoribosyltransferase [Acidiferrobacter sp.]|uniref:anthranilate phosphoribosyltransferase n=1 Tax=Acidiferrobacter sp. TaxID=1872107 RepID=UPI0026321D8B|nr:anthranilate phosphoribosyltransferase [Acidiferrobacter sp.]